METLKNHTIIYDDECPLCNLYTKAFIDTRMLDTQGREPFCEIGNHYPLLNKERAKNEIALINKKDNSVTYGIHSLFKILGHNLPFFNPLFNSKIFRFLMERLYFFISYNRKVIAPGKVFEGNNSCTPSMNLAYRIAYIIFARLVTSVILYKYSYLLIQFVPSGSFYRELIICGGQIIFQATIIAFIHKKKVIHYLGNLMTISLGGAILLLPAIFLGFYIHSGIFFIMYFLAVASLMFLEHIRRVKILQLPAILSFTWVLYRIIVLIIIL